LQDFAEPFSCDYRPRFCLETGDVTLHVTAANDAALQCDLTLYRLECAEHLPVSGQEAAPAAATLAEVVISALMIPAIVITVVIIITKENTNTDDDHDDHQ